MGITILSGPIGAGKTTVARELLALLPPPVSYIDGDTFWSFVAKPHSDDRREVFHVIMRAMTAAAIPFARSGYEVLIDFSIPPQFLGTARKIVKEVPLNYVLLRPSLSVKSAQGYAPKVGLATTPVIAIFTRCLRTPRSMPSVTTRQTQAPSPSVFMRASVQVNLSWTNPSIGVPRIPFNALSRCAGNRREFCRVHQEICRRYGRMPARGQGGSCENPV